MTELLGVNSRWRRIFVPVFFVLLLVGGLGIVGDFGITVDENQSRDNGMVTLKYLGQTLAPQWLAAHPGVSYYANLADYTDRDYGVLFETPVSWAEGPLHLETIGERFRFRHLMTFLISFGGLIAVFQLARRRFNDWRIGLLAATWLVLSPRIFADSFYNNKDAVFMALFAVSTNVLVRMVLRPTYGRVVLAAVACAATIDVRIMGCILPVVAVSLLILRGLKHEIRWKTILSACFSYVVLTAALTWMWWPYLWEAPVTHFAEAFNNMKYFRWGGTVRYRGEIPVATDLPWHYAPWWILISTPLLYLGGFFVGLGSVLTQMVRRRWQLWQSTEEMQDLLFVALALAPLLAVIVLHSVLYDGWRQLYFIYPAVVLVAIRGWVALWRWGRRRVWGAFSRWSLLVVTALALSTTAVQMVQDHPLQNVYFNALADEPIFMRYELDYWGQSYLQGLKYIVTNDDRPAIRISAPPSMWGIADFNRHMLDKDDIERCVFVDTPDSADYFITNYRWHPESYDYRHEVFRAEVRGVRVLSVFKLRW